MLAGSAVDALAAVDSRASTVVVSGFVPNEANVHAGVSDYQDLSTIEFALAGSRTEAWAASRSAVGAVKISLQRGRAYPGAFYPGQVFPGQDAEPNIDSLAFGDARTGSITSTGASTGSQGHTGVQSGSLALTGTATETRVHAGNGFGALTVSGTASEEFIEGGDLSYTDAMAGVITLVGARTEAISRASSGTGTLIVSGTGSLHVSRRFARPRSRRTGGFNERVAPTRTGFGRPHPRKVIA